MQSILQHRRLHTHAQRPVSREADVPAKKPKSPSSETTDGSAANSTATKSLVVVDWEGGLDPKHPRNWTLSWRIAITVLIWLNVFSLDWCSGAISEESNKSALEYHVSAETNSLTSATFVFGVAIGSLAAGPIAETTGRNPIYIVSRFVHIVFTLGSALAPNFGAQLVFRFLAGLGASIILAIHAASIADVFGAEARGYAFPVLALASFLGTCFSPLVGGWIDQADISWQWANWVALIMSGFVFIITFIWLPETFAPVLLQWKASGIRKATGDEQYLAPIELRREAFLVRLRANFYRGWIMGTREYIVVALGAWLVMVYIVQYGFLNGFSLIFSDTYGLGPGLTGTCFLALAVGILLNTALSPVWAIMHRKRDKLWKQQHGDGEELPPEFRLIPAMLVAITFPISIFWLGWTNYASISVWSGLGAVALFGFSWAGIYIAVYQYILDVYGIYAGSALAMITFGRYMAAGGIVIVSHPLWDSLGTHWSCTLFGGLAVLTAPAPFVLYKYGEKVRSTSRFAGKSMNMDGAQNESQEEKVPGTAV